MPALTAIPDLDEREDGATRFRSRRQEAGDQQVLRERGEEALDDRIDAPMFVKPAWLVVCWRSRRGAVRRLRERCTV